MSSTRRPRVHWPRALAAVLLSLALWLVVNAEQAASAWVPVRLSLTLDADVLLAERTPDVQALIVGKRRELLVLLSSGPTLQRAVTADAADTARLELRAEDVALPAGSALVVRDVRPRLLIVPLRYPKRERADSLVPAGPA